MHPALFSPASESSVKTMWQACLLCSCTHHFCLRAFTPIMAATATATVASSSFLGNLQKLAMLDHEEGESCCPFKRCTCLSTGAVLLFRLL